MDKVQIFDGLKVKEENGKVMFDAETVAIGLGISDVAKSGNSVARWSRVNKYLGIATSGDEVKRGDFITEPQFYKLAIKANNATAEKFQNWVTSEVLPSIRKNGMYATDELLDNPDLLIETATRLKQEKERRIAAEAENLVLEQQVAESRPKADYYDRIMKSKSLVTISQIAEDYGWSAQRMNARLHDLKVQHKVGGQWLLYAKHKNSGYTFSETTDIMHADGSISVKMRTKWTQKGRVFIYNLLKQHDVLPSIER